MNRSTLALAIVATSSLLLGGCRLLPSKDAGAPQSHKEAANETKQFAEAIKSGAPTLCTMTKGQDKMEYWVKGKMFKMNATTTIKDDETGKESKVQSYMISDSTYMYSWGSTQQQGIKMKIPTEQEIAEMTEEAKQYQSSAPNLEDEDSFESLESDGYTVNCKSVAISDSDFVVPDDIKFVDPTELMKATTPRGNGQIDMKKLEEMAKQYEGMGDN